MPFRNLRNTAGLICLPGLLLIAGCKVGPNYRRPATPEPATFLNASTITTIADSKTEAEWWRGFNDPMLEQLIATASTNNHDLQIAQARLREARALWTAARFDFAPTIRNNNFYENTQASKATKPKDTREGRHMELYRAGFDATWELDLWGRVRRNVEAARATVEAVEASRDDVLVAVRAEVAANYLELRGFQAQLNVARRNAANQNDTLRLAEALRDGGQASQLDVARARSQLNTTLATIPPLETSVEYTIYRISVLCGKPPATFRDELIPPAAIPAGPMVFQMESPSELLRRRPDVRAAERSLAAATARIGVEVADLFPRVTFVGSIGLEANRLSGFADAGSDSWGFGPHISWPAFDLGRVQQRIKAANANADATLAIYEQTVLLALEETERSLIALGRERQRLEYLREAERSAVEAVDLARQRFRDGIADFLSVLDAERTLLLLQEQIVGTETRNSTSLVALYKALGGGIPVPAQQDSGKSGNASAP